MPRIELDAIDRHILSALQRNSRLSNAELAKTVGLSPSPCLRRVRRMEEAGFILGYHSILDRRAIGLGVTAFARLQVEGPCAKTLREEIKKLPQVVACYILTGESGVLLEIVAQDLAEYSKYLSRCSTTFCRSRHPVQRLARVRQREPDAVADRRREPACRSGSGANETPARSVPKKRYRSNRTVRGAKRERCQARAADKETPSKAARTEAPGAARRSPCASVCRNVSRPAASNASMRTSQIRDLL